MNRIFAGLITISVQTVSSQGIPVPDGRRLRVILAEKFPDGNVFIGGTTGWDKRARGSGIVMDREFNYATLENDFKQQMINPGPGIWNWEKADAWVKHCAEQKQVLRVHGPISPQVSKWAKEDDRTPEELEACMTEFLTKLCQRYDNYPHVKWLDVVNETVSTNGDWFGPKKGTDKWENPWPKVGYDESHPLKPPRYIKLAFEIAAKHAPNTKLIINQHGDMQPKMWNKVKALSDLIDWAHANKLSFHVTEQNVWLKGKNKDYDAQAETFGAILKALLKKRHTGEFTWNVWNISDGDAWGPVKDKVGSILYPDFKSKPAYYALQHLLENPPETK